MNMNQIDGGKAGRSRSDEQYPLLVRAGCRRRRRGLRVSGCVGARHYPEPMASFAERMGHREARTVVQSNSLDDDTRVALWNVFSIFEPSLGSDLETAVLTGVWIWEFKNPHDKRPYNQHIWTEIKAFIMRRQWWEVLD